MRKFHITTGCRHFDSNFPQQHPDIGWDEIKPMGAPINEHIAKLEAEIVELKNK